MFRLPIVKFFNRIFNRVTITVVLVALLCLLLVLSSNLIFINNVVEPVAVP